MNAADGNEASEIELLLPWHAAGTLSPRDAQRVEAALADDPELASRYEAVREELGQTIELNETLGAPSARVMKELFAKIDAEPARRPPLSVTLTVRVREFFAARSPRTLAWSAGAAALAILLQAGVIGGMMLNGPEQQATFKSASAEQPVGINFYVNFAPKVTADEVTKFLRDHKATIIDGPRIQGTYQVQFREVATKEDTARILRELQSSRNIIASEFEATPAK